MEEKKERAPLIKCKNLRALSYSDLLELRQQKTSELRKQQFKRVPRGRGFGDDTFNPGISRNCKREIARINTVLAERTAKK